MTRRGWFTAALVLVCLSLLACKSSAKESGPPTARTTATPSPVANDANAPLRAMASRIADTTATVAYAYTTPSGNGTLTAYWKQPDWRIDYTTDAGPGTAILLAATGYICSENNGGECVQAQDFVDVPLELASFLTAPGTLAGLVPVAEPGATAPPRTERTIAGQAAGCYSVSPSMEFCFGTDGLLLSLSTSDSTGASFRLQATSTDASVPDDILHLPYPPCQCGLP